MICTVGDSKWVRSRLGFFQGDEVSEHQSSSPVLGRWVWLSQILEKHGMIIFELEVSSIYFNAVMIVLCNFERKYNSCDCLQQSHYSSIFAPHTHMLYRKQKNIYLQRRWLKWCLNTQTKWENCSRNTSNHHLFTLICSLVVVMATWEKGRRVKQHAWKKYSYNGNILL